VFKIHERFQQTVQGEGYWAGTPVDFIRLWGCPVGCLWCDTGYANSEPRPSYTLLDSCTLIQSLKSPRVVISGGEPFIHSGLPALVSQIEDTDRAVHIETSGGVPWREVGDRAWVTLSPKQHLNPKAVVSEEFWLRADEIKIVISDGSELDFYSCQLKAFEERGNLSKKPWIYLQPEWNTRDRTTPMVLEMLKMHPTYRFSLQTHKLIGIR
jgi:7-carboxy-7-deazaguanine synthase